MYELRMTRNDGKHIALQCHDMHQAYRLAASQVMAGKYCEIWWTPPHPMPAEITFPHSGISDEMRGKQHEFRKVPREEYVDPCGV